MRDPSRPVGEADQRYRLAAGCLVVGAASTLAGVAASAFGAVAKLTTRRH